MNYSGLVYHAHLRPLLSPLAALLSLSSTLHTAAPSALPTPASILRSASSLLRSSRDDEMGSSLEAMANALSTPPVHVEHVAEAVCRSVDGGVEGVVGVREIREMVGFRDGVKAEKA